MAGVLAAQPEWCISPGVGRFLNQAMASASVTISAVIGGFSDPPDVAVEQIKREG
jgi:hypothetical protein